MQSLFLIFLSWNPVLSCSEVTLPIYLDLSHVNQRAWFFTWKLTSKTLFLRSSRASGDLKTPLQLLWLTDLNEHMHLVKKMIITNDRFVHYQGNFLLLCRLNTQRVDDFFDLHSICNCGCPGTVCRASQRWQGNMFTMSDVSQLLQLDMLSLVCARPTTWLY